VRQLLLLLLLLEVTGLCPATLRNFSEINFSSWYSFQHRGTWNGLCGITGIVMSVYRISRISFHLKVAFRIVINTIIIIFIIIMCTSCHRRYKYWTNPLEVLYSAKKFSFNNSNKHNKRWSWGRIVKVGSWMPYAQNVKVPNRIFNCYVEWR